MRTPRLVATSVTVVSAARITDPYSGQLTRLDWANAARTTVAGCSVQPEPGSETLDGRDSVTSRWRLRGPADMAITSYDRVEVGGDSFEVAGDVQRWPGRLARVEALLQRVAG